jgi:DNA repair protein RecO (recombination protein O)
MLYACEALTLRSYSFGEANKIVLLLTRPFGLLRGVAYGAKKPKSRFGASLEPLTEVRVSFRRREHQELAVIENCEIIRALSAYGRSLEHNLHFGYFAELLVEFSREEIASDKLFRLSQAVLGTAEDVSVSLLARYFEFWILRLEGVLPPLDHVLSTRLAERTVEMLRLPASQIESVDFSAEDMRQLEIATDKLIECHLEKPLKSRKMLKELL